LAYLQSTEEVLRPEQSETGFPSSEVLELFGEIELKSQSKRARCRKLSPAHGQRHGIRITAEPVSMRPVRDREYRGCARPLSTGHTHVLDQVPFGDDPVLFRPSGSTARSSRVWTPHSALGNTNMLYPFLGLRRSCRHSRSFQVRYKLGKHCRYSFASRFRVHWWDAPEF
jgi:hypothetical protein